MKDIEDIYELTPVQEGMLFHTLYAPDRGDYIEQYTCILKGKPDIPALFRAWTMVIRRHPVLRTSFHRNGTPKPLQVVHRNVRPIFEEMDWRNLGQKERKTRLSVFLRTDRAKGFDTTHPPLTRFAMIRVTDRTYRFIWTFHHILLDGWCLPLILREVVYYYQARGGNAPLPRPRPFREYVLWLQQRNLSRAEAFWRKTLKGCAEPTPLMPPGTIRSRKTESESYREVTLTLDRALSRDLTTLARDARLTPGTLFLGAWALLLSRYNLREDILLGITVSGRPPELPGAEAMIGPLLQTIPARIRVDRSQKVSHWLRALQVRQAECIQHAGLPLVSIQKMSDIPWGRPLFDVIFAFENYPVPGLAGVQGRDPAGNRAGSVNLDFSTEGIQLREQAHYPAAVAVIPGKTISLHLSYDTNVYDSRDMPRFLDHWKRLLTSMAQHPGQKICRLGLLDSGEKKKILQEWNPAPNPHPIQPCIHHLFQEQVKKTPDAPAVVFEDRTLTYGELNRRANHLARHLQTRGVGPDTLAAVCLDRSADMVVAILAVLKAGGGYIPMDPDYPRRRLARMLEESRPVVVITQKDLTEKPARLCPSARVCLPADLDPATSRDTENPDSGVGPQHIAYVIHTSGSTGRPKGVVISHEAIANHMRWMGQRFPLTAGDRVLQKTPFSFDASVWEFYAPLLAGATLVMARPGGHQDMDYLVRTIRQQKITVLQMVPSLLRLLLREGRLAACPGLRQVFCGGEVLAPELQERFFQASPAELINLYGPTEACIDATFQVCAPGKPPRIGRPIQNLGAYILDPMMEPVPPGVPGDLYIGGKGLARAYLNRPDLTAAAFTPHPFAAAPGQRLYRTGDLARYSDEGDIEFMGRLDNQLKISGFRIEAGEIENTLAGHPDVKEVVVLAREGAPGQRHLAAYVVTGDRIADPGPRLSVIRGLRGYLKKILPGHMIPSDFVLLESLPRLPNGKVDRSALPGPEQSDPGRVRAVPGDALEKQLAAIWGQVLDRNSVGSYENFFSLGGNSLLVTRVISRVRQALGWDLPVRFLFDHPTVAEFREALRAMEKKEAPQPPSLIPEKEKALPAATVFAAPTTGEMTARQPMDREPRKWTPVIPLQSSGHDPPLFCVHPAGGGSVFYVDLARHLAPDQPVYGLQPRGLDDESQAFHTRVEEMADCYAQAIVTQQSQGPYRLAGASFGGLVAFEMARELKAMGKEVSLLALMDTYTPMAMEPAPPEDDVALLAALWKDELAITRNDLRGLAPDRMLDHIVARAEKARLLPSNFSTGQARLILNMTKISVRAAINYQPGPYNGNMVLFRAGNSTRKNEDPALGWKNFVNGNLTIQWIKGTHQNILREPQVKPLARHLKQLLKGEG